MAVITHILLCTINSSITDWIQAVAAIVAVPGAIAGFVFLFRKDKDKQEQINRLTGIASKIDAQNEILKDANKLLSEQVDVLRNSQVFSKQDNEGAKRLAEIEEKKLKLSVRPYFISNGGQSSKDTFAAKIQNIGEMATITSVKVLEGNIIVGQYQFPFKRMKDAVFHISCSTNDGSFGYKAKYKMEVYYNDQLGNHYKIIIDGEGGKHKVSEPIEILE